jgi:glutathione S-transferase
MSISAADRKSKINRNIIPAFYHYIQAQDSSKQAEKAQELKTQINKLVEAADKDGPFFLGPKLGFVDVQFAPWVVRLNRVLKPYRGWPDPEPGSRFGKWVQAIEDNEFVRATTSTDELYLDSYERYAGEFTRIQEALCVLELADVKIENRPNTSQVADAVNSGRGLP